MDFDGERFTRVSRTQGKLRMGIEGSVEEKDYTAANFVNEAGTIGYSEVTVDGKPDCIFVSRTVDGIVLTMPGEQAGPAPFPVEGYLTLTTVVSGSGAKAFYDTHVRAVGEEPLLADRAWLEREVPTLGQRALEATMKIFAQALEQMDKMMSGLGNAMGEMMEGMGKAMGEAMEGMGKAMGDALGGTAGEAVPLPEKARVAPPEMATAKAPAKKTMPASKAALKKKVKLKAAHKKKAKPAPKARNASARRAKAAAGKPKRKGVERKRN